MNLLVSKKVFGGNNVSLKIKKLSNCTILEAVTAYNLGYEGYYYNQVKTIDTFSRRFGLDEISPDYSVIAFYDDKPIGIALGGIREIGHEIVGWNGGTGVATEFRNKGIGKELMLALLTIYKENNVTMATLEALCKNNAAINLYKSLGYEIESNLKFLQFNEPILDDTFKCKMPSNYRIETVPPVELNNVALYRHHTPWPTYWANIHDGSAVIVYDHNHEILGYSLYKRIYNNNKLVSIGLFQLEVVPEREDSNEIIKILLAHSFSPLSSSLQRTTVNILEENHRLLTVLENSGFLEWEEQVWMVKRL